MLLSVILGVLFSGYIVNKKISNLDIPEKQEQLQEIKANMDNIEVNVDNKEVVQELENIRRVLAELENELEDIGDKNSVFYITPGGY